mgnify:CR=1 FL=1
MKIQVDYSITVVCDISTTDSGVAYEQIEAFVNALLVSDPPDELVQASFKLSHEFYPTAWTRVAGRKEP